MNASQTQTTANLRKQLVHLTTKTRRVGFTELVGMLVAEEVVSEERIMDEHLENHIHVTRRA